MLFRHIFLIATQLVLAACATPRPDSSRPVWYVPEEVQALYGPVTNEPYFLPAVDLSVIDPKFWRQEVIYYTSYSPGTLVIDTRERFLYLIGENGKAMRYGIGVGKEGLEFEGEGIVQRKRQWPSWVPTKAMMDREPERYGHLGKGMPPGFDNPLGARALYLYKDGKDTLFRIHGSNEAWSIGQAISSGCIRLLNQDIIDLYDRVPTGARVVVLQNDENAFGISNQQFDFHAPLSPNINSDGPFGYGNY
ncbi:L,D-transpeptidase [Bartonella sp. CB178]|uniref:L,D-transpeptidase n=1 Tax=Bartonella sp. CB178 TaxID=3112255 RepID=UPI00300E4C81